MTGYSIRRLRIVAVLITWSNYNDGVIYDEVKTPPYGRRCGCLLYYTYYHYTCGFGTRKDIHL